MSESHDPMNPLLVNHALGRLSVVSFIELIGLCATILLIKYGPRLVSATAEADWQHDCVVGAFIFGVISLIAINVTLACGFLLPMKAKTPERLIWAIFAINTIFFSLGMARTGGPSQSFFAQLVPIQLSGILLLQQQKVMITKAKATIWTFGASAAFSILTWLLVVLFPTHIGRMLGWEAFKAEPSFARFASFAATILFVLSTGVAVLAYWLPLQPWFFDFIARNRRANNGSAD